MSKLIIRDGNMYKVFEGAHLIYQTTEHALLHIWMRQHEGPYFYDITMKGSK